MQKGDFSKYKNIYILAFIVLLSFGLKIYSNFYWPTATLKINDKEIKVLVANNIEHWQKGVGGRESLGEYDGMLFLFPNISQHVFVMRDTKFPLDMVWIKKGEVVDIAPNVPTELGRSEDQLTQYLARDLSDRVLEMPAGGAQNLELKIGDKVMIVK